MARILIAEDEILIALSLEDFLVQMGHEVLLCSNGATALARLSEFNPDLIITDYMMPVLDGDSFITRVREHPDFAGTPIILQTSIPKSKISARYDRYLAKPVTEQTLVKTVSELLNEGGVAFDDAER